MKIQNLNHATLIECRLGGMPAQIALWSDGKYTVMDRKGYAADWLERKVGQTAVFEAIQIDKENRKEWYL